MKYKYYYFIKNYDKPKNSVKCEGCYRACSNCGHSYFDEGNKLKCGFSSKNDGLCEIDCRCKNWICYKEKIGG